MKSLRWNKTWPCKFCLKKSYFRSLPGVGDHVRAKSASQAEDWIVENVSNVCNLVVEYGRKCIGILPNIVVFAFNLSDWRSFDSLPCASPLPLPSLQKWIQIDRQNNTEFVLNGLKHTKLIKYSSSLTSTLTLLLPYTDQKQNFEIGIL